MVHPTGDDLGPVHVEVGTEHLVPGNYWLGTKHILQPTLDIRHLTSNTSVYKTKEPMRSNLPVSLHSSEDGNVVFGLDIP